MKEQAKPEKAEAILFRAYGELLGGQVGMFKVTDTRTERCACGGQIVLTDGMNVETVVRMHNETALHTAWRAWRETA